MTVADLNAWELASKRAVEMAALAQQISTCAVQIARLAERQAAEVREALTRAVEEAKGGSGAPARVEPVDLVVPAGTRCVVCAKPATRYRPVPPRGDLVPSCDECTPVC